MDNSQRWNEIKCFYPRHPRGWRRLVYIYINVSVSVSIHATLAGGDAGVKGISLGSLLFLSTPPSRVATYDMLEKPVESKQFLSTPPSRVATVVNLWQLLHTHCFYPRHPRGWRLFFSRSGFHRGIVSIHATLAGGDSAEIPLNGSISSFYPRHPRGWRLSCAIC